MNTAVINIKTNPATKARAQEVAKELGLSLSAVVNALLHDLIKSKKLSVSAGERPSKYLISVMKQAEKNWKKGNHSPVFKTGEEAVAWLEKQGI
ncbi:MAG: type II toxin-antitoxin system RelB/DinJ family antitoxin [Candidatus Levybacteria bacterium]|nr:type II toxin-antitoxin system RelB/DinJ family antitoxin [Candidatus Levybacteria bacterium]